MSDSSGGIDLFFDMPPGKRMSPEKRFEKNTEYERGHPVSALIYLSLSEHLASPCQLLSLDHATEVAGAKRVLKPVLRVP